MIQVDEETKELFLDKLKQLLLSGESIQSHKTVRGKKIRKYRQSHLKEDADEIIETTDTIQTTRETKLLPTPAWVYDLLIRSMSVESAIALLLKEGYVVVDPSRIAVDDLEENNKGLSNFAVAEISAKLLGLEM